MFKMADSKFLFRITISTEVVRISNTLLNKGLGPRNKAELFTGIVRDTVKHGTDLWKAVQNKKLMVSKTRHRNIPKKHHNLYQVKKNKLLWTKHYRNVLARSWTKCFPCLTPVRYFVSC